MKIDKAKLGTSYTGRGWCLVVWKRGGLWRFEKLPWGFAVSFWRFDLTIGGTDALRSEAPVAVDTTEPFDPYGRTDPHLAEYWNRED